MHNIAMLRKELGAASAEPLILALLARGESCSGCWLRESAALIQHH